MATESLGDYLTSKGLTAARGPGSELIVHCPWCSDGDPKGKGRCYLNSETWLWTCFRCGERGGRRSLLRHFGDEETVKYLPTQDPGLRREALQQTAGLAHEMLLANEAAVQYLLDRGLGATTLVEFNLGYVPRNFGLSASLPGVQAGKISREVLKAVGLLTVDGREFLNGSFVIPYTSHQQVVAIREKVKDGKYRWLAGTTMRMFNSDELFGRDEIFVAEGEYDSMILRQAMQGATDARWRNMGYVGVAGAQSWPTEMHSYFRDAKRVYIGFDPDDAGSAGSQKLRKLLGTSSRIVQLPRQGEGEPKTDWTTWLMPKTKENPNGGHGWGDVAELVAQADMHGKRIFTMGDARRQWDRWRVEKPGIKLGIKTLDLTIQPGIKPGQVVIPVARTGSGKTAFTLNLVHNIAACNPATSQLLVSPELTVSENFERMRRIWRFWNEKVPESQMFDDYALIGINDENKIHDLPTLIEEFKAERGDYPRVLHVDYLGYYARTQPGSTPYERTSNAVMELKAIGKEYGCSVISPTQSGRSVGDGKPLELSTSRDSGVVEETADFVIGMFRPDMAITTSDGGKGDGMSGAFQLQLLKSRHGGVGKVFGLKFSNMSLVVVDTVDGKACHRVDQENMSARRGVTYEQHLAALSPPSQHGLFKVG